MNQEEKMSLELHDADLTKAAGGAIPLETNHVFSHEEDQYCEKCRAMTVHKVYIELNYGGCYVECSVCKKPRLS